MRVRLFFRAAAVAGLTALAAAVGLTATAAAAALVYEQGPLDGGNAFPSFGAAASASESADGFAFAAATMVRAVRWWGGYVDSTPPATPDAFEIRFFSTDPGTGIPADLPLAAVAVTASRTATALVDVGDVAVFQFDAVLPAPLAFAAGNGYALSVVNVFDAIGAEWYWLTSTDTGTNYYRTRPDLTWLEDVGSGDLAFALFSPEVVSVAGPSGLGIVLAALGILAAGRRWRHDAGGIAATAAAASS